MNELPVKDTTGMSLEDEVTELFAMEEVLDQFSQGELPPAHYEHKLGCKRFPNLCALLVHLTDRLSKLLARSRRSSVQ